MKFAEASRRVLVFDSSVFDMLQNSAEGLYLALMVVVIAGLSQALGQSVVLFAHHVTPRRFVASLLLSAALYLFGYVFNVITIYAVSRWVFAVMLSAWAIAVAVGLAYSPFLLSFFMLVPYFGAFIEHALSLWTLVTTVLAIRVVTGLTLWQALLCSVLSWLLLQLLQRSIGRPVVRLSSRLRGRIAGTRLSTDPKQLQAAIARKQAQFRQQYQASGAAAETIASSVAEE